MKVRHLSSPLFPYTTLFRSFRTDLEMEALLEVLTGERFITCHSYVQSEINMLMHVADSMGFKVDIFTHILEGYKLADKMKKDRKSTRLNSSHVRNSYAVFCL